MKEYSYLWKNDNSHKEFSAAQSNIQVGSGSFNQSGFQSPVSHDSPPAMKGLEVSPNSGTSKNSVLNNSQSVLDSILRITLKMLTINPDDRPTAKKLLDDPFFKDEYPIPCESSAIFNANNINKLMSNQTSQNKCELF